MKFGTQFDRKPSKGIVCSGGRTHQSFKEECDINVIMKRAQRSGMLPPKVRQEMYGDFSDVKDYQMSLDIVLKSQALFDSLPSVVS